MPPDQFSSLHPVRVVAQRTGLSPDVLRAWEKRYSVVRPHRSTGGQRLYTDADLERLALLARAITGGRSIGQISALSLRELEGLITADETERANSSRTSEGRQLKASYFLSLALTAVTNLDILELEEVLRRATMHLSTAVAIDEVIVPLLHEVGCKWEAGEITPAHEHLGSAAVGRVLAWMGSSAVVPANAPVAVIGTPADQRHELGAKIAATTTSYESWKVVYVGCDLPAESIAMAARQAGARLIALSLIYPVNCPHLLEQLKTLRDTTGPEVVLVTGGKGAQTHKEQLTGWGFRVLADLREYRILLRSLHPAPLGV
jgi:DNA-binding transcriptional MerR regulator/methylmalonyl-CoA mutase cobalamin-binding subunit